MRADRRSGRSDGSSGAVTPNDEELLANYVEGDRAAFEVLVARYERRVYGIALRYFGNPEDAEDAAQEAFVTLLRRASTFAGSSTFATWMYRVTVNTCNDLARKRRRRPQPAGKDVDELSIPAADELGNRELALELAEALRVLDDDTRAAIVLHDLQGVPYADIARRFGVAEGTIKSRIHRGHAKLVAVLRDEPREPQAPVRPPT